MRDYPSRYHDLLLLSARGPVITIQPVGGSIDSGVFNLSVTATGDNLTYQWFLDAAEIVGATSAAYIATTEGDYHVVISNSGGSAVSNIVEVVNPYFEWHEFTNSAAANNGVEKISGGTAWNSACSTVETGSTGFLVKWTFPTTPVSSVRKMLQIMDSTKGTGFAIKAVGNTFSADIAGVSGILRAQYNDISKGNIATGSVAGDVIEIREESGAIEILKNDVVRYTFVEAIPASLAGRVAMFWVNSEFHNVEKT